MTRLSSLVVFYIFYTFLYQLPVLIMLVVAELFKFNFQNYFQSLGSIKIFIGLCYAVYSIFLPGYRAFLASQAYGDRDMKFWEAHEVSGTILKTYFGFVPVLGKLFQSERSRKA